MKKYKITKAILKALKEEVERVSNNLFKINLYFYEEGKHQCFSVLGNVFEEGLLNVPKTFSLIYCEFCHKNTDAPLLVFRMGKSRSEIEFKENLSAGEKERFGESLWVKNEISWERNLSSFGLAVRNIILGEYPKQKKDWMEEVDISSMH